MNDAARRSERDDCVQPLKELQQINLFTNACISVLLQLAMFLVFLRNAKESGGCVCSKCVYIYISSALNELQLEATLAANIDDVKSTVEADLPLPLCPQMPIMKGPGNDDDSGAEGRKGFKRHVCTQL